MKKLIAMVLVMAAFIAAGAFAETSCETIALAISSADAMDACGELCGCLFASAADPGVTTLGPNCIAINLDAITTNPDFAYLSVFSSSYNR